MKILAAKPMAELRAEAEARIDADAEAARLRWITPGTGQALEYQATEREAREIVAEAVFDAARHPFVWAEVRALAAVGRDVPAIDVARAILAGAEAWAAAGAQIKEARRAAKLRVAAARNPAEIEAAAQVTWPEPGKAQGAA